MKQTTIKGCFEILYTKSNKKIPSQLILNVAEIAREDHPNYPSISIINRQPRQSVIYVTRSHLDGALFMNKAYIHPTAIVEKTAKIGKDTKVWHFVHVRENAEIGRECILGHSVYVGKEVKIGNHVKLENRATVYQGVKIEDDVFIGPHVTFTNDIYPRSLSTDWTIVPTLIKQGASIGAGAVIICGITIGEHAMIGAGSIVTKDVPPHAIAYGNPARIKGFVCECGRPMVKEEEKPKHILMKCPFCDKKYNIPREDYAKIHNDR